MLAHQPLHHLQATCVADYSGVKKILLRHLKFLGILFLPRWCVYYNDVWFGASLIFPPSFLTQLPQFSTCPWKISQQPLNFFSFQIQFLFFYFGKITSNWKAFPFLCSLSFSSLKFGLYSLNFFVLFWITYKFYLFLVMLSLFFFIFVFDHYSFYCYFLFIILSFKIKLVRDWVSCYSPSLEFYGL